MGWWLKCRPSSKMKLKFSCRETALTVTAAGFVSKCQALRWRSSSLKKKKIKHLSVKFTTKFSVHNGHLAMSVPRGNMGKVFLLPSECHVCDSECQLSYLVLAASEKSSSPLRGDVRAQSGNYPGVRGGWQTSCREENQHAAGSWRSIICQGQFVFLPLAVDVQHLFLRASGHAGSDPA